VHAVEPFPPVLKSLRDNIALSAFSNVKVHEVGFGEKEDLLPFYADEDWNLGGGTFRAGDKDKKLVGNLRIAAADTYFKDVSMAPVGLIKMDIEGHEEAALKGMRQTLEKHRPLMVFEVTRPPGGTIASFEQLRSLFPANYEFLYFHESQKRSINGKYELADFAPVASEFFRSGDHYNLVAVPTEKLPVVPRIRK
jgi:FkbM family methyltransferase